MDLTKRNAESYPKSPTNFLTADQPPQIYSTTNLSFLNKLELLIVLLG
jgi:hypothetical protein